MKSSDKAINKDLPDQRLRLNFSGTVQGVGFRPHIFRVATSLKLCGFVCNLPDGVLVEIEGPENMLTNFIPEVKSFLPAAARIEEIKSQEIPVENRGDQQKKFAIIESLTAGLQQMSIGADTATCPACLKEMRDPADRRYGYPFINCTDCGPRLTIVKDIPFDRQRTSMAEFPLCHKCREEYENPNSRRFHAEATACPECGPQLSFFAPENHLLATGTAKSLALAKDFLQQGKIIAIKGLGGFHLAVDADNHDAVKRLRQHKQRDGKPFALMVKNLQAATRLVHINEKEKELLLSPARPIVLLRKKEAENLISPTVAENLAVYGIMLPYTPLHHMLLGTFNSIALVMTSANLNSEPIVINNHTARIKLAGIADYFLCHNRDIIVRLDDSITFVTGQKTQIVRRSRGYVPQTLRLNIETEPILALGGHLKNSLCLIKDKKALLSPHIGDLDNPQARNFFQENIALIEKIGVCKPEIIACDLHPDYYSSIVAEKLTGKTVIKVQHHHAHIVSCMADNQISGKVLGIALDGTGMGVDGKIWGGEFLCADAANFVRVGQIAYFPLLGGEKALLEPWRCALSLLKLCTPKNWLKTARRLQCTPKTFSDAQLDLLLKQTANRPLTSSMGRFFDAAAAILGFCGEITYEGQAAIELETLATQTPTGVDHGKDPTNLALLPWEIIKTDPQQPGLALYQLNLLPMIAELIQLQLAQPPINLLARLFHDSIVAAVMAFADKLCREYNLDKIVLSGGCFQNRLLLEGCLNWPKTTAKIYCHKQIPTNDGGLALGQAIIAANQEQNFQPMEIKNYG